ncbi:MAG TPA: peptidoglycan DD-metalloendopeptidase family protein [Bacteroidota bacterium]
MNKPRLYYFSAESLSFKPLRWAKSKYVGIGVGLGIVALWMTIEINQSTGDVLGLGLAQTSVLLNENQLLRNQLQFLSGKLDVLDKKLASLNERGNELRSVVDLPKIDEDVWKVGVGGVDERIDYVASPDINNLLNKLQATTNKAERELQLQSQNYEDVTKQYAARKQEFAHLPSIRPIDGFLTSSFGLRLHPILDVYKVHEGQDIACDPGTRVYATADGIVDFAGAAHDGLGNKVEINHGYGYKTIYGHLSKPLVKEGKYVKRGDLIALSGNTGLSTAPHLHYEVRFNGVPKDPRSYFLEDYSLKEFLVAEKEAGK